MVHVNLAINLCRFVVVSVSNTLFLVSAMASETYWDPGNLLQITESDGKSQVQCVGRARSRYNARCRWTVANSDTTVVLGKLRELASSPPSKVTKQDLEELAVHCLCRDYHSHQWLEVAQRWEPVVAQAVKHSERTVKGQAHLAPEAGPGSRDWLVTYELTMAQLELSLARKNFSASEEQRLVAEKALEHVKLREAELELEHTSTLAQVRKHLQDAREHLANYSRGIDVISDQLRDSVAQVSGLQHELGAARGLLDKERAKSTALEKAVTEKIEELEEARRFLEEAKRSREREVVQERERQDRLLAEEKSKSAGLEEANQHLKHRSLEEADRMEREFGEKAARIQALEETEGVLKRQLSEAEARATQSVAAADEANRTNEALLRKVAADNKDLDTLRTDLEDFKAEVQRRADDSSALARQLQTAQTDNQALLSIRLQLAAQNGALFQQIAALDALLAKCWRRRIRAWLDKRKANPTLHR